MKYIEKVSISKFRSFGNEEKIECSHLNIFSGGNDSGKSNVLKALNLFFNNESELSFKYNSESDFNKWFRDNNERGERNIIIEVVFSKGSFRDLKGINKGFIGRKIFSSSGAIEWKFFDKDGAELSNELSIKRANAVVNEKIQYIYIPAIRDAEFRKLIQRKIQSIADSKDKRSKSSPLKASLKSVEEGLNLELKELNNYVKNLMGVEIEPSVNFSTLLESMSFDTNEKIAIRKRKKSQLEKQKVALNNRGEGIQMQFFSFLLWYISKMDTKHSYIWGYEEPEIAFELKRQFEILETYRNEFSKVAQIFITSHSPAFALCEADLRTNVYRVSYEQDKGDRCVSRVYRIETYYDGLFEKLNDSNVQKNKIELERDIWGLNLQKISKMLGSQYDGVLGHRHISAEELLFFKEKLKEESNSKKALEVNIANIESELTGIYPNRVFICEDENGIDLWTHLFNISGITSVNKIFTSLGCTNSCVEIALEHKMKEKSSYKPIVFRQLDRDGFTNEQVAKLEGIRNARYNKFTKYKVKFLPVNEIENFAVLNDTHFTNDLVKSFNVYAKLSLDFNGTINSNLHYGARFCKDEEDRKLFAPGKSKKMTEDANTDILKFFPGKSIGTFKPNFNPTRVLLNTQNFTELHISLQDYLNEIKAFFS